MGGNFCSTHISCLPSGRCFLMLLRIPFAFPRIKSAERQGTQYAPFYQTKKEKK